VVLPRTGFPGFHLVPPPPEGVWRVTDWHDPFDPPPPPPPIGGIGAHEDDAGRFDAPDGEYSMLYCATESEGALGEQLAAFAPAVAAAVRIEDYLESEPDPEFADDYLYEGLTAEDIESFHWHLAHAPCDPSMLFIDLWHPATGVAILPRALSLLRAYRLKLMDRRALADERRASHVG
jgi:hypothetical protein